MTISKGIAATANSLPCAVWQLDHRFCAHGKLHGERGGGAVDADFAVEGANGGLDILQVARERGVDKQTAHAMGAGLIVDACQGAEKPFVYLSHHEMVPRCALAWVPLLGERGGSMTELETVAGGLIVVEHGVEQLVHVVLCQGLEQVAVAHIACGETVAVGMDVGHQRLQHLLLVRSRDAKIEGQGIGCLAAASVGA